MFSSWVKLAGTTVVTLMREIRALSERESDFLLNEFAQFRGLMPLLKRSRDRARWNAVDTAELHGHLRRMTHLSPYLVVAILPGSFVALPLLAIWRDRRRSRRNAGAAAG